MINHLSVQTAASMGESGEGPLPELVDLTPEEIAAGIDLSLEQPPNSSPERLDGDGACVGGGSGRGGKQRHGKGPLRDAAGDQAAIDRSGANLYVSIVLWPGTVYIRSPILRYIGCARCT